MLHLRLTIRSFQVSLLVLRLGEPLSDLSHAARHSDRFHKVLLVRNQLLNFIEGSSDVVQETWHVKDFVALWAF